MNKSRKNTQFQKTFGNHATSSYSKEYMNAYCKWLHSLTNKQRQTIKFCNDLIRKHGIVKINKKTS